MSLSQPNLLAAAGVTFAGKMISTTLGGCDSFPLHQVLHLAIKGDPSGQDFVLFPAGQPPCCSKIAADGVLEVGQLAAGVHAVHYVCGVEPRQRAQHLRGRGDGVCVAGGRDLGAGGLQVPPGPAALPFQGWRGNGHDAGCCVHLAGATEADGQGKEEAKQTGHLWGRGSQVTITEYFQKQ